MPYTFTIRLNSDVNKILSSVEKAVIENGGRFSQDNSTGTFSISGVHGSYQINGDIATITIIKKPFIVSMATVQQKIMDYFTSR